VFGQLGVLAQRKRDVLEHREVGEQRPELIEHAHAPAQRVQPVAIEGVQRCPSKVTVPTRAQHAPDQPQDGGLAGAGPADQRHDPPARKPQRHTVEDDALAVAEADLIENEECLGSKDMGRLRLSPGF
jgi:hypothetical protein